MSSQVPGHWTPSISSFRRIRSSREIQNLTVTPEERGTKQRAKREQSGQKDKRSRQRILRAAAVPHRAKRQREEETDEAVAKVEGNTLEG